MDRRFYLDLAAAGLRMPIGTDLVLREKPDHEARLLDGRGLGEVVVEAAHRYRTPLAFPLMDLTLEKAELLTLMGVPTAQADQFHFSQCPDDDAVARLESRLVEAPLPRMRATLDAIRHVARQSDLVPVGMAIGPFSLMTKLVTDPITPVYLSGSGITGHDDPEVKMIETCLELAIRVVLRSLRAQVQAGARAVCVCEPAANKVFISPMQMEAGSDVFDRLVMRYNRHVRELLRDLDADLIFHDCGELTDAMLGRLAELDPAILSLGSSRKLWEDARHVPTTTVLFGNLPTKKFYSDTEISAAQVEERSRDLIRHMKRLGRPLILGSECDVLSVPGCEATIRAKVETMLTCPC